MAAVRNTSSPPMMEIQLLRDVVRTSAQAVHQAHHQDRPGTFMECPMNTCYAARQALEGQ